MQQQPTRTSPYVAFLESPNQLEVLDQRKLPLAEVKIRLRTVDDVKHAIENMVVRGAPLIGICGAFGMALAGEINDDLDAAKRSLDATRPTAVNLAYATSRMLAFGRRSKDNRMKMIEEAKAIAYDEFDACEKMADLGSSLIPAQPRDGQSSVSVIHHCNTGGLATFGTGTALGCVMRRWKAHPNLFVWVDETRPRLQGAKLTAWELNRLRIPNNVIADGAAGSILAAGRADCVMFGADRIVANGDVVNKIGTYPLSVVARENGVPVYCVAPTSTIDLSLLAGAEVKIEERSDSELLEFEGRRFVDGACKAFNPAFDVTPFRYITAIVTEEMICYPPFRESLATAKAKALARQQGVTLDDAQAASGPISSEKIQEILEKAQPKRTSNERLFPSQNDPLEEKRPYRREDPRTSRPKTSLGDGTESRFEPTRDEPRVVAPRSNPLGNDDEGASTQAPAMIRHYGNVRKSNIVMSDEGAPQQVKSNVRIHGAARSRGIFGDDEPTQPKNNARGAASSSIGSDMDVVSSHKNQESIEGPPAPTSKGHVAPAPYAQEAQPSAKGHHEPPKREERDKGPSRGHYPPPSPDRPPQSQSKGHMTPPSASSNVFG